MTQTTKLVRPYYEHTKQGLHVLFVPVFERYKTILKQHSIVEGGSCRHRYAIAGSYDERAAETKDFIEI